MQFDHFLCSSLFEIKKKFWFNRMKWKWKNWVEENQHKIIECTRIQTAHHPFKSIEKINNFLLRKIENCYQRSLHKLYENGWGINSNCWIMKCCWIRLYQGKINIVQNKCKTVCRLQWKQCRDFIQPELLIYGSDRVLRTTFGGYVVREYIFGHKLGLWNVVRDRSTIESATDNSGKISSR